MRERVFFNYISAQAEGFREHAESHMGIWAKEKNFRIIGALGQSLHDGFEFWIEYEQRPELPSCVRRDLPWTPFGEP